MYGSPCGTEVGYAGEDKTEQNYYTIVDRRSSVFFSAIFDAVVFADFNCHAVCDYFWTFSEEFTGQTSYSQIGGGYSADIFVFWITCESITSSSATSGCILLLVNHAF